MTIISILYTLLTLRSFKKLLKRIQGKTTADYLMKKANFKRIHLKFNFNLFFRINCDCKKYFI